MGKRSTRDRDTDDTNEVDPHIIAEWIGLAEPIHLGTAPISLPQDTIDKLGRHGERAELTTAEVGLILGITRGQVSRYCTEEGRSIHLAHRRKLGTTLMISAAALAEFIAASNQPVPVPSKLADRKRYEREVAKVVADACRRHNLTMPEFLKKK